MWDIGGQESLRNSWSTYFADSDFVIFVVDSTDRERLHISKTEVSVEIKPAFITDSNKGKGV